MNRTTFLPLAVLAGAVAPAPAAEAIDARVERVHVTQGVQEQVSNTIPLIAHRRTAVRVGIVGDQTGVPQDVTGRLAVKVDGATITPPGGVAPLNEPYDVPPGHPNDLALEDGTMNFELPPNVLALFQPANRRISTPDVSFTVTIFAPGDANKLNDSKTVNGPGIVGQVPVTVFYTRVLHKPSNTPIPDATFVARGRGDAFLAAALPFDDICPSCLYRRGADDFTFEIDRESDGRLSLNTAATDPEDDGFKLLTQLMEMRGLLVADAGVDQFSFDEIFSPLPTFLFGWVDYGAFPLAPPPANGQPPEATYAGLSSLGAGVAFGSDDPRFGQQAMAHEIAHAFALLDSDSHPETLNADGLPTTHWPGPKPINPSIGWDVGSRLPGNPAENQYAGRVRGTALFDVLSPAATSGKSWTGRETTLDVLSSSRLNWGIQLPAGRRPRTCTGRTFNLMGALSGPSLAARSVRLQEMRAWTYDWCTGTFIQPGAGSSRALAARKSGLEDRFQAVVRIRRARTVRTVRAPLNATDVANQHFSRVPGSAPAQPGHFALPIGLRSGESVESVRIEDRRGTSRFAPLTPGRAPRIAIAAPSRGASLGRAFTLRWRATDPDTPRSRLRFQVAYSPDGGSSVVPVAVRLRGTSLRISPEDLPATGGGRGVLRVYANDGLNTASAEIRQLSAPRAGWALERPRDPRRR